MKKNSGRGGEGTGWLGVYKKVNARRRRFNCNHFKDLEILNMVEVGNVSSQHK